MAELGFYDEKENRIVVRAAADYISVEGEEAIYYFEPETAPFYDVDKGLLARLVKKGTALLIADMQEDEDLELGAERKWGGAQAKSYLGVLLKSKNKVIGSIELVSGQPNKFDEANSRLLTSIAVQAAIEVQNAQEVQEREQRLAQQIQQMDIIIDKEKQSEQVDDIVKSNFFKMVQEKARNARKDNQE
jgi:GAF domain-containing protein